MKTLRIGTVSFLILMAFFSACDPCSDCHRETNAPSVEATFYNIEGLLVMEDSLELLDTLRLVTDSLLLVVDSILNGGTLDTERNLLEDYIDSHTHLRSQYSDSAFADELKSIRLEVLDQIGLLNRGRTPINSLELINTGIVTTSDSAIHHYLPMLFSGNESSYALEIGDEFFTLDFNYQYTDQLDEDRRVVRSVVINSLTHSGFDSLFCLCIDGDTVDCAGLACDARETSIKAYF